MHIFIILRQKLIMQESYQDIRNREKDEENKVFIRGLIILIICAILFYITFLLFHPAIEKGRIANQGFITSGRK